MRWIKISLLFYILGWAANTSSFAQYLVIDDTYSAQQLVQNVLVNSPCANVSNFSVSGGGFSDGSNSFGYFSAGSSGFPFATGVVLSTGKARSAVGPNSSILSEDAINWMGDGDLSQALSISGVSDATALEFDFVPLTSTISFDYIFSSEEYHGTAPCTYSDGFAFLLKEVGSSNPYQNLAIIPNTTIPVKVTTVHDDIPGGCPAQNATYFGGYNAVNSPTNFNGQTVIMTAKGTVTPGVTYHIKLVIADEGNPQYDSAIFLGGNSFDIGINLGPDRLLATNNPLCSGDILTVNASITGNYSYQWYKDGVLIPGATTASYTINSAGTYTVQATLSGSVCAASGKIVIEYSALPNLSNATLAQCDDNNDGITYYDLTKANTTVANGDSTLTNFSYFESLSNAQNNTNAISTATNYHNTTTNQITVKVTNKYGCVNYATINLTIAPNTIPNQTYTTCDNDLVQDGITAIDLAATVTPTLTNGLPTGIIVTYYANGNDAIHQTNSLPYQFTNTTPFTQTIYALLENGPDCYGIIPIAITIRTFSPANFGDEIVSMCQGSAVTIGVPAIYSSYSWSSGQSSNSIVVTNPGSYTITVSNQYNCFAKKNFSVIASSIATIDNVAINDFSETDNSIQVNASGFGDYLYSIDGIHYQNSSLFTDVSPGEYTVYVKDIGNCGIATKTIFVLDYPKYFTPNNDGYNDIWDIKNLYYYPKSVVSIFDRFGKFIYNFDENHKGWDGTLNHQELYASDYWFVIQFQNGRSVKGHFSLKR